MEGCRKFQGLVGLYRRAEGTSTARGAVFLAVAGVTVEVELADSSVAAEGWA